MSTVGASKENDDDETFLGVERRRTSWLLRKHSLLDHQDCSSSRPNSPPPSPLLARQPTFQHTLSNVILPQCDRGGVPPYSRQQSGLLHPQPHDVDALDRGYYDIPSTTAQQRFCSYYTYGPLYADGGEKFHEDSAPVLPPMSQLQQQYHVIGTPSNSSVSLQPPPAYRTMASFPLSSSSRRLSSSQVVYRRGGRDAGDPSSQTLGGGAVAVQQITSPVHSGPSPWVRAACDAHGSYRRGSASCQRSRPPLPPDAATTRALQRMESGSLVKATAEELMRRAGARVRRMSSDLTQRVVRSSSATAIRQKLQDGKESLARFVDRLNPLAACLQPDEGCFTPNPSGCFDGELYNSNEYTPMHRCGAPVPEYVRANTKDWLPTSFPPPRHFQEDPRLQADIPSLDVVKDHYSPFQAELALRVEAHRLRKSQSEGLKEVVAEAAAPGCVDTPGSAAAAPVRSSSAPLMHSSAKEAPEGKAVFSATQTAAIQAHMAKLIAERVAQSPQKQRDLPRLPSLIGRPAITAPLTPDFQRTTSRTTLPPISAADFMPPVDSNAPGSGQTMYSSAISEYAYSRAASPPPLLAKHHTFESTSTAASSMRSTRRPDQQRHPSGAVDRIDSPDGCARRGGNGMQYKLLIRERARHEYRKMAKAKQRYSSLRQRFSQQCSFECMQSS